MGAFTRVFQRRLRQRVAAQLSWDSVTEQMEGYYADALPPAPGFWVSFAPNVSDEGERFGWARMRNTERDVEGGFQHRFGRARSHGGSSPPGRAWRPPHCCFKRFGLSQILSCWLRSWQRLTPPSGSIRRGRYLKGFSDAIIPASGTPEEKIDVHFALDVEWSRAAGIRA